MLKTVSKLIHFESLIKRQAVYTVVNNLNELPCLTDGQR